MEVIKMHPDPITLLFLVVNTFVLSLVRVHGSNLSMHMRRNHTMVIMYVCRVTPIFFSANLMSR